MRMQRHQVDLNEISRAIADLSDPLKIILMGSRARGTEKSSSDIDLLVVGERPNHRTWSRRRHIGDLRRSLPKTDVPIDILFFTPEEITHWQSSPNHVIYHALREGSLLYERA